MSVIETHPVVNIPFAQSRLELDLEGTDDLVFFPADRSTQYAKSMGLIMEQFLLHRLRVFPTGFRALGRVTCKGSEDVVGLVARRVSSDDSIHLNRFHFFEAIPDEGQRFKALIQIFMDLLFQLHLVHAPQYPETLFDGIDQAFRPTGPCHLANHMVSPSNVIVTGSNSEAIPRAAIHRFTKSGPSRAVKQVTSKTNLYHPPVHPSRAEDRIVDGCLWDLFATGIILFEALSPSATEFVDYCLGIFATLESQRDKTPQSRYADFLLEPINEVFASGEEAAGFLSSSTWTDPVPEDMIDNSQSALINLLNLNFSRWPGLGEDRAVLMRKLIKRAIRAPYTQSDTPIRASDLFFHLWSIWRSLHEGVSEDELLENSYPQLGLPKPLDSVSPPFSRLRLPLSPHKFDIELEAFGADPAPASITLDWRCQLQVDPRHVLAEVLSLGGHMAQFHIIEIDPQSGYTAIEFSHSDPGSSPITRQALLEFGPCMHPVLVEMVFEPGISAVSVEKRLDLPYLEGRIAELFPNGDLPREDAFHALAALWRQCRREFHVDLLDNDRDGWYGAFAVLASNTLMLSESIRNQLGLHPLLPENVSWAHHDLARHIAVLESIDELTDLDLQPSFKTAACLHLLKSGADAIDRGDSSRLDGILARLEPLVDEVKTKRKEELIETIAYLRACADIQRLQRESNP